MAGSAGGGGGSRPWSSCLERAVFPTKAESYLPHTLASPSADSRSAVVSNWRKNVHRVLVNRFGGLSLRKKSVVRLTDRPDMTLAVYRGR